MTLIGDGELHADLVDRAGRLGISDRVEFVRNLPNAEILNHMRQCDLFVYQSDNYELSKGTMEAALAGLPIVLNKRSGGTSEEVQSGPFLLVDDTVDGYEKGLRQVIEDAELRERLGREAARYGWRLWNPERMEAEVTDVYRSLIEGGHD